MWVGPDRDIRRPTAHIDAFGFGPDPVFGGQYLHQWLLTGFGVVSGGSCDQGSEESAEQSLSASTGVVDDLEEAEIGGPLVLRDTAMPTQPRAQQ
jgi:hypothetical protein